MQILELVGVEELCGVRASKLRNPQTSKASLRTGRPDEEEEDAAPHGRGVAVVVDGRTGIGARAAAAAVVAADA